MHQLLSNRYNNYSLYRMKCYIISFRSPSQVSCPPHGSRPVRGTYKNPTLGFLRLSSRIDSQRPSRGPVPKGPVPPGAGDAPPSRGGRRDPHGSLLELADLLHTHIYVARRRRATSAPRINLLSSAQTFLVGRLPHGFAPPPYGGRDANP